MITGLRVLRGLLVGVLLLGLFACAGGQVSLDQTGNEIVASVGARGSLPLPSDCGTKAVLESLSEVTGGEFDADLPHPNVFASNDYAYFNPDWIAGDPEHQELAFAVYRIPAAPGSWPLIQFNGLSDTLPGVVSVGLANYSLDRWDWLPGSEGYAKPGIWGLDPDRDDLYMADYLAGDPGAQYLTVLVVATGTDQVHIVKVLTMDSIIQGIRAVGQSGYSGADFEPWLDHLWTTQYRLDWDFGGGAVPNTVAALQPVVELGVPGEYQVTVTCTSKFAEEPEVADFTLTVLDPQHKSHLVLSVPAAHGKLRFYETVFDTAGNMYRIGSCSTVLHGACGAVAKYTPAGELAWCRVFDGEPSILLYSGCPTSSGGLAVCGRATQRLMEAPARDNYMNIFLTLDGDGGLLSQKVWGREYEVSKKLGFTGISVIEGGAGQFYVLSDDSAYFSSSIHLNRLDADGNIEWIRKWNDLGDTVHPTGMVHQPDGRLVISGYGTDAEKDVGVLVCVADAGDVYWAKRFEHEIGLRFDALAGYPDGELVASGLNREEYGYTPSQVVLRVSPVGNLRWASLLDLYKNMGSCDIALDPAGRIWSQAKTSFSGTDPLGIILQRLDPDGGARGLWNSSDAEAPGLDLAISPAGGLTLGWYGSEFALNLTPLEGAPSSTDLAVTELSHGFPEVELLEFDFPVEVIDLPVVEGFPAGDPMNLSVVTVFDPQYFN